MAEVVLYLKNNNNYYTNFFIGILKLKILNFIFLIISIFRLFYTKLKIIKNLKIKKNIYFINTLLITLLIYFLQEEKPCFVWRKCLLLSMV